jgi:hypothetical protein
MGIEESMGPPTEQAAPSKEIQHPTKKLNGEADREWVLGNFMTIQNLAEE